VIQQDDWVSMGVRLYSKAMQAWRFRSAARLWVVGKDPEAAIRLLIYY
jgi:hypothetical protein